MKYIILLIVIILILISFKLFSKKIKNDQGNSKEEIIDLKKDPKTNEYKPKE